MDIHVLREETTKMKKTQPLTDDRRERVYLSMQLISVLASVIQIEHAMESDVKLGKPEINMFAGRILKDAIAIQNHLSAGDKLSLKTVNKGFIEEYSGELWRLNKFFIGLDIEQIREFADGIKS